MILAWGSPSKYNVCGTQVYYVCTCPYYSDGVKTTELN